MKKGAIVCLILFMFLFGSIFLMRVSPDGKVYASDQSALSVPSPSASRSVINETYPSTVLTCDPAGGIPPYTYQWWEMKNLELSYSAIPGATSSSYTFTPNNTATTPV